MIQKHYILSFYLKNFLYCIPFLFINIEGIGDSRIIGILWYEKLKPNENSTLLHSLVVA